VNIARVRRAAAMACLRRADLVPFVSAIRIALLAAWLTSAGLRPAHAGGAASAGVFRSMAA
jgi:hypothetical protein